MKLAVLTIGDELLLGEVLDGNAAAIGALLYDHGIVVQRRLTVGDREPEIAEAIGSLASRFEYVVATGGLGPTVDDVTAASAAAAAGVRLVLNGEALAHVRKAAGKMEPGCHPQNEVQAFFPETARLIPNPAGTACGFSLPIGECTFFFLPGVPAEMLEMLRESVLPFLLRNRGAVATATAVLRIFGISEADAGDRIARLPLPETVRVAFGVEFPEIHLKLRVEGDDAEENRAVLESAAGLVKEELGAVVLGGAEESLDTLVAAGLRRKGVTLSVAESCTGGLVAKRITDLPGSSAYFLEGAVTYTDAAKKRCLGVPEELLAAHGAVSPETAAAMAEGMRRASGSDLAVAITGIAGPGGGSPEKPVGTVFIAVADGAGTESRGFRFAGTRDEIRTMTSWVALDWLRRKLT